MAPLCRRRRLPASLLLLLAVVIAATAAAVLPTPAEAAAPRRSLLAKPTTTTVDDNPTEKPTGQCTAADEADPASCFNDPSIPFKCGNTQEKSVWNIMPCPGTTVPCRVSPGKPAVCSGETINVVDNGVDGIALDMPGTIAGPVLVKGGNGYCTFPDAYSKPLRAPTNNGPNKLQSGLGHVDFCYCKSGPVTFSSLAGVASAEAPADALPCEPVTLPTVTAVDACGVPVPVSATVADADVASAGAKLACGRQTITFTAAHPHKPNLKAKADHAVHVADKIMPVAAAASLGRGTAVCKKYFETACGAKVRLVPTLSLSGCEITATYAPQRDACGNEHVIPAETLVLDAHCDA